MPTTSVCKTFIRRFDSFRFDSVLILLLWNISTARCCALRATATVCIWCGFHNQWMANIVHVRFVECVLTAPRTWRWTNTGSKRASSQIRMVFTGLIAVVQWIRSGAWWNAWCAATRTHLWHIRTASASDFLETGTRTKALANDAFECESKILRKESINHWIDRRITCYCTN